VGLFEKEKYETGDLVFVDDERGFRELVIILSPKIPMYHRKYEFYQVFSIAEGSSYIVPCQLVIGEYKE
jgi:hypothetical protein